MTAALKLEEFDMPIRSAPGLELSGNALTAEAAEEIRIAAYESGYTTGWQDAHASSDKKRAEVSEELARNLRDLSFTYFEARTQVLASVEPVLRALFEKVFPTLLPEATAAHVLTRIHDIAAELADAPVELSVSPDDAEIVEKLTPGDLSVPLKVASEPALASGQAFLRVRKREQEIDVASFLDEIRTALNALAEAEPALTANG